MRSIQAGAILRWVTSRRYRDAVASKRILVIRHGQSEWNALGLWQGQADPPLTALGRQQAQEAVDAVQRIGFDTVASSNLERAHHTAKTLAAGMQLAEPTVVPLLAERDAGKWSGLSRVQIEEQYPGYLANDKRPPGYESDEDLLPRVLKGLAMVAALPGETIACVAHGGVIYVLEAHFGKPFERIGNLGSRWFTVNDIDSDGTGDTLSIGEREPLINDETIPQQI